MYDQLIENFLKKNPPHQRSDTLSIRESLERMATTVDYALETWGSKGVINQHKRLCCIRLSSIAMVLYLNEKLDKATTESTFRRNKPFVTYILKERGINVK